MRPVLELLVKPGGRLSAANWRVAPLLGSVADTLRETVSPSVLGYGPETVIVGVPTLPGVKVKLGLPATAK